MFQGLSEKFERIVKKLRGRGVLTEQNIAEALKEVRLALLEADVNFKVARDFVARVKEAALGQEVWKSLTPGQMVVKIVHDELTTLLGGTHREMRFASKPPTVIMLVGLHGTGKTTTAGKLGHLLKRRGRFPILVAADLQRPAAVRQVQVVAQQAGVTAFARADARDPVAVVQEAVQHAKQHGHDVVIVDSAGRLHIDEELMAELKRMREASHPDEVLLVVDAMAGQDAVTVADQFHKQLGLDGLIMTKMDGDARGGAALSAVAVTGCPIAFIGVGERVDALEPFHPDRMASRILGMGDVLTLVERAQETMDEEAAREMERKLRRREFTLQDFLDQMRQVRKMGPLDQLLEMIPGLGRAQAAGLKVDEKQLGRIEAIINSMTREERHHPEVIDGSRRRRIARGSGTTVQDVNRLLKQFDEARRLMRQIEGMSRKGRLKFPI
ncbi:MAG: signal recognition particle protein [Armatimonadetes bacterium]|nr:signal recognition particle protein [Armatimonadota bacterium]